MDTARRMLPDYEPAQHPDAAPALRPEEFAKILRLRPNEDKPFSFRSGAIQPSDIAAALELVQKAAGSIRDAEARVRDSEMRTQALLQRAAGELKSAEARADAAEALATASEARAREAQARAEEAENWLRQIFATISQELPARQ